MNNEAVEKSTEFPHCNIFVRCLPMKKYYQRNQTIKTIKGLKRRVLPTITIVCIAIFGSNKIIYQLFITKMR